MAYLRYDECEDKGLEEDEEPIANSIDTWARGTIRVQVPDEEFLTERAIKEKRKVRALQFIEDKVVRVGIPKQHLTATKIISKTTSTNKVEPIITKEKKYTINKEAKVENKELAVVDNEVRVRKAQEVKNSQDIERKLKADKELLGIEEKKRQKFEHEMKRKLYTYDLKGKILFLPKEAQKFPEIPAPKTQWITNEDTHTSPHYEQIKLIFNSNAILKDEEKKYKECRTGNIPENVTVTLAKSKAIKVYSK